MPEDIKVRYLQEPRPEGFADWGSIGATAIVVTPFVVAYLVALPFLCAGYAVQRISRANADRRQRQR